MMRETAIAILVTIVIVLLLTMATIAPRVQAQPATVESAPAITYNSACGSSGYGKQWVAANGRAADELHAREGEPGKHVNADGYWATCAMPLPPKPPRNCRAAAPSASWSQDGNTCATNTKRRMLDHGQHALYLRQHGPTRGQMLEQCIDGERVQRYTECRPATHCSTRIEAWRGGVVYVYDARRKDANVPIGTTVDALSSDGRRWPVSCVTGDWVVPAVLPGR